MPTSLSHAIKSLAPGESTGRAFHIGPSPLTKLDCFENPEKEAAGIVLSNLWSEVARGQKRT